MMIPFHIPHEIFREIVSHLDKDVEDERQALKNLRLTDSMFNDIATPVLFSNHSLSLGRDPHDVVTRLCFLREISPESAPSCDCFVPSHADSPQARATEEGQSPRGVRPGHIADITKHIKGLIFTPEIIVPRAFQKRTGWVDAHGRTGDFINVTADAPLLRKAMSDAGLRFVTKALEFLELLPHGGDLITTLDVRVRYDGDNFEAIEEYFCKTMSLFFYYTCSSIATQDISFGGRNTFGNCSLRNARRLKFTTEEFDAPNYFIVPPSNFIDDAEKYFHDYPLQLHRRQVETVHREGGEFEMFPQVRNVEFSYLIDEVNKSSSRWEHSSSEYSERSYMTRLIYRPESISFAAKGCWMNLPDISKNFSFANLSKVVLSEMVIRVKWFCDCFLTHVSSTLVHLELHQVETFIQASSIMEPGFGEDYFGVAFNYISQSLENLTTIRFSELMYHDTYFSSPRDTVLWKETDEMPLIIPDSGGRKRPIFSPFDNDFKDFSILRDTVKRRRVERRMKEDPFLKFCERGDTLMKTPIKSAKYLKLLGASADA